MKDRPIISIKEARKLLGVEAQGLNDVEVMGIILLMSDMAKSYLKKKSVKKSN